jgi:putative oxidoreductase
VCRDGCEYVLVIALTAGALATAGPGRLSLDHVLALDGRLSRWIGILIVAAIGVGGALAQMTAFWRPATPPGAAREQPSMTAGHADPGPD